MRKTQDVNMNFIRLFILLSVCFAILACNSSSLITDEQIISKNYQEVKSDTAEPDSIALKYPMYPDGLEGVMQHVRAKVEYPQEAKLNMIQGVVIVKYIIKKNGTAKPSGFVQRVHPSLDYEAKRIIRRMDRWVPGYIGENPVRVEYALPINFLLR